MSSAIRCLFIVALFIPLSGAHVDGQEADAKLRIICFGAHPDDAEFQAGGVAAKWAQLGHHVKFVSVTNGDIGHWRMAGGPLAKRRTREVEQAAEILGIDTEVLDIHDGELIPSLGHRKTIVRLIRDWKADIVMAHRPWDYHPDHRYTGVLVQDAAFMVTVPHFCPDTPHLKTNPVFFYFRDRFIKPYPFRPDIAVSIDDVWDKKLRAMDTLVSQVHEGGVSGNAERDRAVPKDPAARLKMTNELRGQFNQQIANQNRDLLIEWYGEEAGRKVQRAEVFEICEYGRRPSKEDLRKLFPFYSD